MLPALQHLSTVGLDAHRAVLLEDAALASLGVGGERHVLAAGGHARLHVAHRRALELGGERQPARGQTRTDFARALPQLAPPVSCDRLLEQPTVALLHGRIFAAAASGRWLTALRCPGSEE